MTRSLFALSLAAMLLAGAAAAQDASPVEADAREALWNDPQAIRRALLPDDDLLLSGLLDAYELRDAQAASRLQRFLAEEADDAAAARRARGTLAMVQLRLGAYADAAANMEMLLAGLDADAEGRQGMEQTLGVARALAGAEPQRRLGFAPGSIEVEHDMAGLARAPLSINGQARAFVFDTGANFSVATQSEAEALGLEMLGESAGIGSTSQESTAARLAVARTLSIGNLTFENVVFLVLPDESLSFAGGLYRIPGILGFPVISRMERIEVEDRTVSWSESQPPVLERDLFVDGLTPRVYARIEEGPPVQFAFDTGANRTSLRPVVLREQPGLDEGGRDREERIGGAGGVQTVQARVIPVVVLRFDEVGVVLEDVSVAEETAGGDDIHGRLGQDVLARGYIMDFPAGDFALDAEP